MFVRIESNGDHSVEVSWRGVMTSNNEEIVTGYKVSASFNRRVLDDERIHKH